MAAFETEEERRAREEAEARDAFLSRRDLLAPPPESPAPAPRGGPAGDSPAARLFRQRTAQIAPSAPAALGAERNPVKFNNELNRPAPKRDLLAPVDAPRPARSEPSRATASAPRDLLAPVSSPDDDLDRQIDEARRRVVGWKPSFFGGLVGQYDRKKYEQARESLQQLEEARAYRQRQKAASAREEKPFEVDGALGFRNPDGSLKWERPPAREKEAKAPEPPKVVDRYDDREGNRILVWQDHTGKKWEEKAQYQGPKPRDPDADYNRREGDRDERYRREQADRDKREASNRTAEQKAQAQRDASRAWLSIDEDLERYPTLASREAAKRKAASYFGVQYPPGEGQPPAQSAAPARGAAPGLVSSHGPAAAPAGGGVIKMVRDASGRLVPQRG